MSETMVKYTSKSNPFNYVLIKADDSFVIVGDAKVSDLEIQSMIEWEDVQGWDSE